MILSLQQWFATRSPRERWLIILMLAVALPLLAWLLVIRPLESAYDKALEQHLQAVDRNGRVHMLAKMLEKQAGAPRTAAPSADIGLIVADAASQSGLMLDGNSPAGANAVSVSVSQTSPAAAVQWLSDLEARGMTVQEWRMTPAGTGTVSLTARIAKAA